MTKTDAANIVNRLAAAFPHPPLTPDRTALLVDEIALLADPSVAAEAATGLIRNGSYFPKISEFRAAYHAVAERRRDATVKLEEAPRAGGPPTWVQVWTWASNERVPREKRAFPQQRPGYDSIVQSGDRPPDYLSAAEYEALEAEWREAGSPTWKATEVVRAAGVAG